MRLRSRILFCFLLAVKLLTAQNTEEARVRTDKNKILLGEPLLLSVEANLPAGMTGSLLALDTLEHFEFLAPPLVDSSVSAAGIRIRADYRITSFDSGRWVIPSIALAPGIQTKPVEIDVVFSDFNPQQDYHEIKDIEAVKQPKKNIPWWWIALTGMILLVTGIFLYKRITKRPSLSPPLVSTTADPYNEAVAQLRILKDKKTTGKSFHTELAAIFRIYVFREKGILSLQNTTDDLLLQLKNLEMPAPVFEKMAQSLRLGDYVKFAKYNPSAEDDSFCFRAIAETVDSIHQQKQQKAMV